MGQGQAFSLAWIFLLFGACCANVIASERRERGNLMTSEIASAKLVVASQ